MHLPQPLKTFEKVYLVDRLGFRRHNGYAKALDDGFELANVDDCATHVPPGEALPKKRGLRSKIFKDHNWRTSLRNGRNVSASVTLLAVVLLTVSLCKREINGRYKIYDGDCATSKRLSVFIDLFVNVLSTLLLGASNAAIQMLSAPTRSEVDRAHARNVSLQIGISSLRNWRFVPRWRRILWILLAISSLPLHLLLNSVFIPSSLAVDYVVAMVDNDFFQIGSGAQQLQDAVVWMRSDDNPAYRVRLYADDQYKKVNVTLQDVYENVTTGNFDQFKKAECVQKFSTYIVQDYAFVFALTDKIPDATVQIYGIEQQKSRADSLLSPMYCDDEDCGESGMYYGTNYVKTTMTRNSSISSNFKDDENKPINSCFAIRADQLCQIEVIPSFLALVVLGSSLGILGTTILLRRLSFTPLITTGDAIASFLTDPVGGAIQNSTNSSHAGSRTRQMNEFHPWTAMRRRLRSACTWRRLRVSSSICLVYVGIGVGLLVDGIVENPTSSELALGLSPTSSDTYVMPTVGLSLLANTIIANIPQLCLSVAYYAYNSLFTCFAAEREIAGFVLQRKPLRVSTPQGASQRSTYWLSLPLKFGIPLMAISALLHWLMSQSIYLTNIMIYDPLQGRVIPERNINACSWSALGLLILVCVGTFLFIIPWVTSLWKMKSLMPEMRGESLRIMMACSAARTDNDQTEGNVMFGVLEESDRGEYGVLQVGFSDGPVAVMKEGHMYCRGV